MALKEKLPERYPKLIEMYRQGEANALDMLKTDMGVWPPPDMDIVHPPDFMVKFRSTWSTSKAYKHTKPGWKNVGFSLFLMQRNLMLGAAFFLLTAAYRATRLRGFVNLRDKPDTIHFNDLYRFVEGFRFGRRFIGHTLNHEFKHVVQARDRQESLSSALDDSRLNVPGMLVDGASKHVQYLAEECEIQARMHTIIMGASHQFERRPLSKMELYECLQTQGVHVPTELLWQNRDTEEGEQAYTDYKPDAALFDRYADKSAIYELNRVIANLKDDEADNFWDKTIPFIYGDMIELWGDRLGHKRMGHTHNIQLRELFYKTAQRATLIIQNPKARRLPGLAGQLERLLPAKKSSYSDEQRAELAEHLELIKKLLTDMDKDDAVDLACLVAAGVKYEEYGTSGYTPGHVRLDPIAKAALKVVQERPDLTVEDSQVIRRALGKYSPANKKIKLATFRDSEGQFIPKLAAD